MKNLEDIIVSEYESGNTVKTIARANKISEHLVHKVLAEAGITNATPTADIVTKMYADGADIGTIARELGIGRNAVDKYLPYISAPRKPWTSEEDEIVLSGRVPNGRTREAANIRRHRLKNAPSPAKWVDSPLRKKRLAEHLTQAELANISNVPISTIRAFEQGVRDINAASISIIERLSDALHCKDYREILPKKYVDGLPD